MKMKLKGCWIATVGILLLMVGCGQPEVPDARFYRISVDQPIKEEEVVLLKGQLLVRQFLADGLVSERPLIYTASSGVLQQYHYHSWSESPTRLIQEQLVKYLRRLKLAEEVVTPEMRIDADYELIGKIKLLEHILTAEPSVSVELELGLVNAQAGALIFLGDYTSRIRCSNNSVEAAVLAFGQAISNIFGNFAQDVQVDS